MVRRSHWSGRLIAALHGGASLPDCPPPGIRLLRDDIESLSGANAPWRCVRFGLDGLVPPSLARYHFQIEPGPAIPGRAFAILECHWHSKMAQPKLILASRLVWESALDSASSCAITFSR